MFHAGIVFKLTIVTRDFDDVAPTVKTYRHRNGRAKSRGRTAEIISKRRVSSPVFKRRRFSVTVFRIVRARSAGRHVGWRRTGVKAPAADTGRLLGKSTRRTVNYCHDWYVRRRTRLLCSTTGGAAGDGLLKNAVTITRLYALRRHFDIVRTSFAIEKYSSASRFHIPCHAVFVFTRRREF